MDRLIPTREPPLKQYFFASSVEEAVAYLSAHRGEAQVVGGGTSLLPVVLKGTSVSSRMVDVSRIRSLKRIRSEGGYLVLGGAVTLAQVLRADTATVGHPILRDMAMSADTPRMRELATLAGSIVSAQGNSSVTTALSALNAEAEIANLTGSQWLPVRSLLVRPGSCRVNSMSEILVSLRIRLPEPGAGASLVRGSSASGVGEDSSVIAVSLGFDGARNLLSWLWLALGTYDAIPEICQLGDLAAGQPPAVDTVRQAISQWMLTHALGATDKATNRARRVAESAQRAFDTALERARLSLANGML